MHFVDTNVLLYSVSTRPQEQEKARRALAMLSAGGWAVSVQVLQEFYTQASRPGGGALSPDEAAGLVRDFCRSPVQEMTVAILHAALVTAKRFRISYWDAAIIEAARALGCTTVLTEDLNHGQDYGGVRAENPFLED